MKYLKGRENRCGEFFDNVVDELINKLRIKIRQSYHHTTIRALQNVLPNMGYQRRKKLQSKENCVMRLIIKVLPYKSRHLWSEICLANISAVDISEISVIVYMYICQSISRYFFELCSKDEYPANNSEAANHLRLVYLLQEWVSTYLSTFSRTTRKYHSV